MGRVESYVRGRDAHWHILEHGDVAGKFTHELCGELAYPQQCTQAASLPVSLWISMPGGRACRPQVLEMLQDGAVVDRGWDLRVGQR